MLSWILRYPEFCLAKGPQNYWQVVGKLNGGTSKSQCLRLRPLAVGQLEAKGLGITMSIERHVRTGSCAPGYTNMTLYPYV